MKYKTYALTPDVDLSKLTPENFMDYMEEAGEVEIIEIDPDCDDCAYYTKAFETPTMCPECEADQAH